MAGGVGKRGRGGVHWIGVESVDDYAYAVGIWDEAKSMGYAKTDGGDVVPKCIDRNGVITGYKRCGIGHATGMNRECYVSEDCPTANLFSQAK
ncbi:hypothetical protein [Rhodopirellula baltica]|uniref:hypothetical protein n=1 Tax=Rhodopirellula baltica TaxID=265606 RepID=UPI001181AB42|nr:hypothetical protein [Rhodopirellula baltica]